LDWHGQHEENGDSTAAGLKRINQKKSQRIKSYIPLANKDFRGMARKSETGAPLI
jgi:hypothetical protein